MQGNKCIRNKIWDLLCVNVFQLQIFTEISFVL